MVTSIKPLGQPTDDGLSGSGEWRNVEWASVRGVVRRGYGVASGRSTESEYYPRGAIELQAPKFRELGLDLSGYFLATLNISIHPYIFKMEHPQFTFRNVEWTPRHPPEHFSFSKCRLLFNKTLYEGWVYYPHPETKQRHFQQPDLIEVIARKVAGIQYGDEVEVQVNPAEILLVQPP